jgi:polyhydroxyalkanoate synthesis repressor PhaR
LKPRAREAEEVLSEPLILIKRYPNRKLYNTQTRGYVRLESVAELIRQGHEIQVIDHVSGEDLTAVILSQIILDQEKKQAGSTPREVLAGLVQAGGKPGQFQGQELPRESQSSPPSEVEIEQALAERGVATHRDLNQLAQQIAALRARLESIAQAGGE